jgi:hypothetical protein
MKKPFNSHTTFPQAIIEKSSQAVFYLEECGYFEHEFNYPEEEKTLFYEKLCESLIPKFIKGNEISWEFEELYALIIDSSVRHGINELEKEGIVHVFDDMVVLAEKDQF